MEAIREYLASVSFDKAYTLIITITAAMVTELGWSMWVNRDQHLPDSQVEKDIRQERIKYERPPKSKKSFYQWRKDYERRKEITLKALLVYILGVCAFFALVIFVYTLIRGYDIRTYGDHLKAFWNQYRWEVILVAIIVKITAFVDSYSQQWLRGFFAMLLVVVMVFAPMLISFPTKQLGIPLELITLHGRLDHLSR